jgi:TPR repeat protein
VQQAAVFLSRGNNRLAMGDIVAARLFYERAADLGSAPAATALGKTYDPAFLASIATSGVKPNPDLAAGWYRKGAALGDNEAESRLGMIAHQ